MIMLSLRGRGETNVGGSRRYQVCIPPPLSGDTSCGDGPRFFQVSVDIRSTQPVEQFLGTLGQTAGYTMTDSRGSAPWRHLLRDEATKTIVFVTDDNARTCDLPGSAVGCSPADPPLTATLARGLPGRRQPLQQQRARPGHPHAGLRLPLHRLHLQRPLRLGLGDRPHRRVHLRGRRLASLAGPDLHRARHAHRWCARPHLRRLRGVGPFFDAVATAVERTSRIDCTIPIPEPPSGMFFEHDRINVFVDTGSGPTRIGKVPDAASCDARGGWHYDDESAPSAVVLCPATCDAVQAAPGATRSIDVQFGCQTIPI
ncbi:MAG: hypothetical protein M5U28_27610 [Sandaracinaceae bacterium]|nr:hypothetical protein [Sandaracinaceae bacterium]